MSQHDDREQGNVLNSWPKRPIRRLANPYRDEPIFMNDKAAVRHQWVGLGTEIQHQGILGECFNVYFYERSRTTLSVCLTGSGTRDLAVQCIRALVVHEPDQLAVIEAELTRAARLLAEEAAGFSTNGDA